MERKNAADWVSAGRDMAIAVIAGKGRPKKKEKKEERVYEILNDDLKKFGLHRGLAKDRERWKAQVIRKTSDLCEHGQGM